MTENRTRRFADATRPLMKAFMQRRPLRGGSLITTVFGDSIAARRCEVSLSSLIKLLQPFGLTERLVRTSIGRLAQDNWVTARRVGRLSYYRLSSAGEISFSQATQRIYAAPAQDWRGSWTLLIVPGEADRESRERIKDALQWSGFGQLASGVHIHPEIDPAAAQELIARCDANMRPVILQSRSETVQGDRRMVELGWDLDELERRYTRFVSSFVPALAALAQDRQPEPMHCFHIRTLLIHEYRKVHLIDPQLPPNLLPQDWAGTAAYELCRQLYLKIADASDRYVQGVLSTSAGAVPAPDAGTRLRFAPAADPPADLSLKGQAARTPGT